MKFVKALLYSGLLVTLTVCALAQREIKKSEPAQDSCLRFVQDFYDWYAPNTSISAAKRNKASALEFALKNRSSAFPPDLVRQLEEGMAQAKKQGEPFLDFDPVLNSQDPASRYLVDSTTVKGDQCVAKIHGVWSGKKSEKPDVIADLILIDGQWRFTNFHYPNSNDPANENLLSMLAFLRKAEKTSP